MDSSKKYLARIDCRREAWRPVLAALRKAQRKVSWGWARTGRSSRCSGCVSPRRGPPRGCSTCQGDTADYAIISFHTARSQRAALDLDKSRLLKHRIAGPGSGQEVGTKRPCQAEAQGRAAKKAKHAGASRPSQPHAVMVSKIRADCSEDDVLNDFQGGWSVEHLNYPRLRHSNKSRGYAIISFHTARAQRAALELDKSRLLEHRIAVVIHQPRWL